MTEFLIEQALCLTISGSISFHLNYFIIQTGQFIEICYLWSVKLTEDFLDFLLPNERKNGSHFCHVDKHEANFFQPTGNVFGRHVGGQMPSYGFNKLS